LKELNSPDYAARTERNVLDSDGTLILYRERLSSGTLLTHRLARRHNKPLYRVRLDRSVDYAAIMRWLREAGIARLNIAGPRGSSHAEIYEQAFQMITKLLRCFSELPLIADEARASCEPCDGENSV
jgi:hypothetical protein